MKKILALVLALIMCVSCLAIFAGCNDTANENKGTETEKPTEKPTEAPEAPATLEAAKTFLFSMYKDSASPKNDYDIVGKVMIGTTAFEVTWTVDSDKISIKESSKADFWTVDLPDANAEEFEYVLTATIKNAAGETVNVTIKRTMAVIDNTGLVTAPVADVAYKLFVEQVTLGQKLYALNTTQKDEGKYINTTNDPKAANDYFVEVVDGGFKFYTTDANGAKLYVHAHTVKTDDGKVSKYLGLSAEEASVWAYNADKTGWITTIDNIDYYVGTYNNYATLSISEASYLKPESIGVSSFTCGFMTKEYAETLEPDAEKEIEIPTNKDAVQPTAGEKYTISMIQGNKENATYYLTGSMNGYYMATSTKVEDAANAYVEVVDGGYNLYVIAAGAKKYINVVKSGTHTNNVFEDAASTVWVWDADLKTLKAECEGEFFVLGTGATGTYTTFGMVKAAEKNFYGQFVVSTNEDQTGSTETPEPNPNPGTDPEPPVVTEGLEITAEKLFAGITGTGYADHDGDHTVEGLTINTNTVMRSNNNTGGIDVIQLKKEAGVITVKNATVKKLTIRVVSSYDYENNVSVSLGGNALTLPNPADVHAAAISSGISNANGYAINYYDVVVELDAAATGDLVITNSTSYAVYFAYIIIE
ncbi:MAG: hypothetical protein IKA68_07005 [Clostridia bacterium]|nr:hypothetical protein [Clostridia bacterium]